MSWVRSPAAALLLALPLSLAAQDASQPTYLVLLRVTPGKPFVYHSGSAWTLGNGGSRTRADWDRYDAAEPVTFAVPRP